MKRRPFLNATLGLMVLGPLQALAEPPPGRDRLLVAVHLAGGNDGLNTVVPYRDPLYRKARPTLGLSESALWVPGGPLAFHGALAPLRPLWDAGHMAVVNGVGYPRPVRSHFRSAEIWQSATPDASPGTGSGWLGRMLAHNGRTGVCLGTPMNLSLAGGSEPLVVGPPDTFRLPDLAAPERTALERLYRQAPEHLRQTWNGLQHALDLAARSGASDELPRTDAGKAFATVLGFMPAAQVYHLSLQGFDTHSNQGPRHHKVLDETATALSAFCSALSRRGLAQRTLIMLYSEFGRRVEENASGGTDHGAAGPLFLLGPGVRGGWYGDYPSLSTLDDGDLRHTVDFRQVYASILHDWLGQRAEPILGEPFTTLPLWA